MSALIPSLVERLEKAVRLEGRGELEQARARYRAVLDENPDAPEALSLLGQLECRLGDHHAAVFHLRRAARLAPARPDIHLGLGHALNNAGERRAAAQSYLAALEADPGFAPGYVSLGRVFSQNGHHEKALRAFERARELDPSYPEVHYELGVYYKQRGRIEPAIAALLNCVRLNTNYRNVHFEIAELFILRAAFGDALTHLEKHLGAFPDDAQAWVTQATACIELGMLDEAAESCHTALQIDPAHSLALTQLGRVYFERHRLADAKLSFKAAINADAQNALAHAGLAEVFEHEGQFEQALRQISNAGDPQVYNLRTALLYARMLHAQHQTRVAIDLLNERLIHRVDPAAGRRRCYFMLGDLYADQGDFAKAFKHFQNANDMSVARFDMPLLEQQVERICRFFTVANCARLSRAKPQIPQPVFVVGMPGAGTRLVQELLGNHEHASACTGKLTLAHLAVGLPSHLASAHSYPEALADARASELASLALQYLRANQQNESAVVLIDGQASSWLYLGLAAVLFPGMRVIHIEAAPPVQVMDCYTRDLTDPELGFSGSLRNISGYAAGLDAVMNHWVDAGEFRVLKVRFETLLKNPQTLSQRIVAFAGLDWRPRLMSLFDEVAQRRTRLEELKERTEILRFLATYASASGSAA